MTLCKICSQPTHSFSHSKFGTYDSCDACHFISKQKKDHISPEEALIVYNRHENYLDDPTYTAYFVAFVEKAITPYANAGRKGFDYGSGPQPVLVKILESKYGYHMAHYDYFFSPDTQYTEQKYDLITITEVIEHIEDPVATLMHLKSLLRTSGILCVMTTFHRCDQAFFMDWHYMRDRTHISFFTETTFRYIAEQIGLNILFTDSKRYITLSLKDS